jgi:hypothetical protein
VAELVLANLIAEVLDPLVLELRVATTARIEVGAGALGGESTGGDSLGRKATQIELGDWLRRTRIGLGNDCMEQGAARSSTSTYRPSR